MLPVTYVFIQKVQILYRKNRISNIQKFILSNNSFDAKNMFYFCLHFTLKLKKKLLESELDSAGSKAKMYTF